MIDRRFCWRVRCPRCDGAGDVPTSIAEAPTTGCRFCDGQINAAQVLVVRAVTADAELAKLQAEIDELSAALACVVSWGAADLPGRQLQPGEAWDRVPGASQWLRFQWRATPAEPSAILFWHALGKRCGMRSVAVRYQCQRLKLSAKVA